MKISIYVFNLLIKIVKKLKINSYIFDIYIKKDNYRIPRM